MLQARNYTLMEVCKCDYLNVRKGAGTKYGIISKLVNGRLVEVVSKKNNWAKIRINGGYGYCSLLYLKTPSKGGSPTTPELRVYKVLRDINLRDTPNWNGKIIRVAYKNELLDVMEITNDFAKVWDNGRELYAPTTNGKYVYLSDTGQVKPGTGGDDEEEQAPPLTEEKEPIRPQLQYKNEFWIDIHNPDMPDFRFNTSELNMHMIEKPNENITMLKYDTVDNLSWDGDLITTNNTYDTTEIEVEFYVREENYKYVIQKLKEISRMSAFRLTLGWNRRYFRNARLADNIEIEEFLYDDIVAKITLIFELQPYSYAQEGIYYTKDIKTGESFLEHNSVILNNYEESYPKVYIPIPHTSICPVNEDNKKVVTLTLYSHKTNQYYYYKLNAHSESYGGVPIDYIYAVIDSSTGNVYEDTTDKNLNYLYDIENEFPILQKGKTTITMSENFVDTNGDYLKFKIIPNWREL